MVKRELEAMGEAWRRGEWLGSGCAAGTHSDPTAARAAYQMEADGRLRTKLAELEQIVAEAKELIEGVAHLLGSGYADALTLRYLEGRPWQAVADSLGVCLKTAYNRVSVALDTIDGLGKDSVVLGRGVAAD